MLVEGGGTNHVRLWGEGGLEKPRWLGLGSGESEDGEEEQHLVRRMEEDWRIGG